MALVLEQIFPTISATVSITAVADDFPHFLLIQSNISAVLYSTFVSNGFAFLVPLSFMRRQKNEEKEEKQKPATAVTSKSCKHYIQVYI